MAARTGLQFLGKGLTRTHLLRNKAWIAGQWVDAMSKNTYPVHNPSNGEIIAEVPDMAPEDVHRAVREAYTSQRSWAILTAKERAGMLRRWFDIMVANKEDLAKLVALEVGKPLQDSLVEVLHGADCLEWFSEEAKRVYGDIIPPTARNKRLLVTKQPVGVAALITPWNSPIAMITRKAAAALAAGCTTVVKPSEETPLCALALAELSSQAGIPPGVFNVLTCSRQSTPAVGQALTGSDLVAKLSFTGSTAVGKVLLSQCAETVKRVSMELGGCAPMIIFDSADVEVAVRGTLAAKFRNTGQTCISPNRILVQSGIHDLYVEELARAVSQQLRLGDPFQEGVNQGPLINESAVQKPRSQAFTYHLQYKLQVTKPGWRPGNVEQHVSDALSRGGEVVVGGARDPSLGGSFFQPSVLVGASTNMQLAHEETFGPVAPIFRFEREEEAIAMANDTPFGLAGYLFSRDVSQVWRVSEQLECGMVGVNEGAILSETIPFGGIKQSGIGREMSKYGLDDYLNIKYTCIGSVESEAK